MKGFFEARENAAFAISLLAAGCACAASHEVENTIHEAGISDVGSTTSQPDEGGTSDAGSPGPPEVWRPPIDERYRSVWPDDVGWKTSEDSLCSQRSGPFMSHWVWSDNRGVFALVSSRTDFLDPATAVFHNDGSGWEKLYSFEFMFFAGLTGFTNGPLLVYGESNSGCGVQRLQGGERTCSAGLSSVHNVFVVNDALAYGVYDNRVIAYDGTDWFQLGDPIEGTEEIALRALWADEQTLVVVDDQAVFLFDDDASGFFKAADIPPGTYGPIWGFGGNDIWIGTDAGELMHFDGGEWTVVSSIDQRIRGLWGHSQQLFLHTGNALARLEDDRVHMLTEWSRDLVDPPYITHIWGNSPSEVFLSILDNAQASSFCGSTFVVWYDGQYFRRF